MPDCECRINIKSNYGHGTGLLTYNNGVVAKVDVENGRIYDMLLHRLLVARILKNGFLKDYPSFNKVFSYKLPDPTEHQALFSCYNSEVGMVGFWESRIIQAFVLKDQRRDIKNQSPTKRFLT